MPRGEDDQVPVDVMSKIHSGSTNNLSIDDSRTSNLKVDIPDSSLGYPDMHQHTSPNISPHGTLSRRNSSSAPPSRRNSFIRPPPLSTSEQHTSSPINTSNQLSPGRRSKLSSPVFTSLREKDDPYFLALPDSSRTKILSNSAPDLNTLPHPPPRAHRRPHRDVNNTSGRLMEHLHSSRRNSLVPNPDASSSRPVSRRSTIKTSFRLQPRSRTSSSSSSPYGSDSESEIFDDDHSSMVGSAVSTRPSSFSSTASFGETFLRPSASTSNLNGKGWGRTLHPSFSALDLVRRRDSAVLPERDTIETEDCRFLEIEYHRYWSPYLWLTVDFVR
jgi:hypothetical protein